MIFLLKIFLSLFIYADDVDCQMQPCHKRCIPPGFKCVPYDSMIPAKPYIPVVEGQSLVYFNSSEFPYKHVEQQMVPFFQDWAKSCPEEKREGSSRGRPNKVSVESYSQLDKKSEDHLRRTIAQVRANTIIVQLTSAVKSFSHRLWSDFLNKIPVDRGCFILAPVTVSQYADVNTFLNLLEKLIIDKKHSCQILRVNEEVHGTLARACAGPMKRSADQLDVCQLNHWVRQVQLKACDMDPRAFIQNPTEEVQPAGAAAGL